MLKRCIALTLLAAGAASGCSSEAATPGNSGGSNASGSAGTSTAGTAGTSAAGAGAGMGGSAGAGGTAAGGGSAGSAGAAASGGVAGGGGTGGGSGASGSAGTSGAGGSGGGTPTDTPFSFFVTSLKAMVQLSGTDDGFGGDLTYGETGPGAGLRGADKICTAIAEMSMPGNGKTWRAFLSVTDGGDGEPVNAIDRIGAGPWYDRLGRLVANSVADLQNTRPANAHEEIVDDLPNEDGVPNHQPDPSQDEVDNHDTLTGSNEDGELDASDAGDTCNDWTSAVGSTGEPRLGHSWPAMSGQSWIAGHPAGGCGAGVNLVQSGPPMEPTVGSGGGYGGIYCFALQP